MTDVLRAINENVVFDDTACQALITFCNDTARTIDEQAPPRQTAVTTGATQFKGYFSRLFATNAETAKMDAIELAARLQEVAAFAGTLRDAAHSEQQRRNTARAWQEEQDRKRREDEEDRGLLGGILHGAGKIKDDVVGLFRSEDEARPPVGPGDPQPNLAVSPPRQGQRAVPQPGTGGSGSSGTSSAVPAKLESFATTTGGLNSLLTDKPSQLRAKLDDFKNRCLWGTLEGTPVVIGFEKWNAANEQDVAWAKVLAAAFRKAGGESEVSTLSNSALAAALRSKGVDATRDDITIDPPLAMGAPPTTGYAVDPVNTATGNFLETEVDLGFPDSAKGLVWARTYNSFDTATGAFGPGWSSWAEAGLAFTDEAARLRLDDGRVIVFPRMGEGWDRATGEAMWLTSADDGYRATNNTGKIWAFDSGGRLLSTASGIGTETSFHYEANQLIRITHGRGRSIDITWHDERITALTASDGRTATYGYDAEGRLIAADADNGRRTYEWADDLIARVNDADGVVEVDNEYDAQRRVRHQRTRHGRLVKFTYLDGRTTVVSDEDGTRSNTWLHDGRGRLIGVVDAHEYRQSMSYDGFGNQVLVTERNGESTVHEYDQRGRRVRTVTPSGADLTFGYDDLDRVTTVVTESGAVSEYTYEGSNRSPATLTDPEGGITRFTWASGLLTEITDPVGVRIRFDYNEHGDLIATTDARGNSARLERDPVGRVVAAITPLGNRTTFAYGPDGHLRARRDPDGATWRFEHTAAGRLTTIIDPLGNRTRMEYGEHGDETRTIDALGRSITRELDDLGNLASSQLPDGSTWRFAHDALSRLTETIDPTGASWRHDYGANGELTATIDPTGVRRSIATNPTAGTVRVDDGQASLSTKFDALGRVLSQEQTDGSVAMASYDRCGRPVELLDAEGGLTKLKRDDAGRVTQTTSPQGAVTFYEYDECGRLAATIDPLGARTTREYDPKGRLAREVMPTGEVSTWEHDVCGRVTFARRAGRGTARYTYDAAGRVTQSVDSWFGRRRFRYDAAGQLVEAINGNGGVTRYRYDENGRAVAITDPLGNTTHREFDAMNRCVAESDPSGRTTRAGYDGAGRQSWQIDAAGHRTEWAHDEAGRLATTSVDGQLMSSITRDLRARSVTISDHTAPSGEVMTHELRWNRLGQLIHRARDGQSVTWAYDAEGRRTAMTTPDGRTTSYEWDTGSRLVSVEHPLLGRVTLAHDAAGRLVEASAGGTIQHWSHSDGFVTEHSITDAEGTKRTSITRDSDGRINAIDRDGSTTRYTYDEACQLIAAQLDEQVDRWVYDPAGRMVAETVDGLDVEHEYDAAGQLRTSRESGASETRHDYDAVGRRVRTERSDGSARDYRWSALGWLQDITDHAGDQVRRTSVHIDAIGELASVSSAQVWWDTAAFAGKAVLVGDQPVLSMGAFTGVGDTWANPGWRTARSGQGMWAPSAVASLPEGLGVGGAGELLVGTIDPLEWMGARVYDPGSRGFLSIDPLDPTTGAGWTGNPYAYAGNDPLNALDPLGLHPATDADLNAYAAAHAGPLAGVKEWTKNNWEYLAGAGMVIAGGVLIATGVGGPAGAMLIGAGADALIQKATTGEVNWTQVAVSGAASGVGFGAGALAAKAGASGVRVAATEGIAEGAFSGGGGYLTDPGPHTPSGMLRSTVVGGAEGAIPLGGASQLDGGIRAAQRRLDNVAADTGEKLLWTSWQNYPKIIESGHEYAQIGERLYSRHAVDRMQPSGLGAPSGQIGAGRSISPNFVEDALRTGDTSDVIVNGVTRTVHTSGTVQIVTEQGGRIIVTVNSFSGG